MSTAPPRRLLRGLGDLVVRHRRWTLVATLLLTLGLGVLASGAMNAMVLSRWEAPGTESVRTQGVLAERYGTGNANFVLIVEAENGDVDAPDVERAGTDLADELAAEPGVGDVWSYWSEHRDPMLRADDARQAVVLAWVTGDATEARERITGMIPDYTRDGATDGGAIDVRVAGGEAASTQISALAAEDFLRAEVVIIPTMLLLLVVVYRRVVPALLTLGVGVFSVLGTMALLRVLTGFVEISTFAANITLVMGIGLGIDYSLFVISRYREEIARGQRSGDAVARAVQTAGRTVVFSGLTVAAALSVLLALPYPFLQSFGYAGVLVVVTAVVGALVPLPGALAIWGHRVVRKRAPNRAAAETGRWHWIGTRVLRRPIVFGTVGLLFVLLLGSPVLGLRIGLPDDRVLPADASTRQAYDILRADFSQEPNDAIQVLGSGPAPDRTEVADYASELSTLRGIAQVNSVAGSFVDGQRTRPASATADRLTADTGSRLELFPTHEALSGAEADVDQLVERIRAMSTPYDQVLVGGYPAELTDFRTVLMDRVPLVATLILAVTFVILFLMSGSVLIPVKATVLNLLSLSVMFGALVFVFQDGRFADLLGFTATGTLDPAFPILMFCVAYGLSMDYEVFMLSRIKEEYDATGDNNRAVLLGLSRSAPLITAAAVILALSFGLYATGQIMYLQMLGVGTALAILVDATVIRAILVPAFMALAGRANWWAPGPLRRIHERFGISESAPAPTPERVPVRTP